MADKHAPGPWIRHNGTIYQAREDGGKFYAEMAIAGVFTKEDELLIAAAPDLLDVLEELVAEFGVCGLTEKARAAIAKATGEQS